MNSLIRHISGESLTCKCEAVWLKIKVRRYLPAKIFKIVDGVTLGNFRAKESIE